MKTPAMESLSKFNTDLLLYLKETAQQVVSCEFCKKLMNPIIACKERYIIYES